MKQPSVEATPTKVDAEALPHRLIVISSPELSLKLKGNVYSNPFSTSLATMPKCWVNYLIYQHLIVNSGFRRLARHYAKYMQDQSTNLIYHHQVISHLIRSIELQRVWLCFPISTMLTLLIPNFIMLHYQMIHM